MPAITAATWAQVAAASSMIELQVSSYLQSNISKENGTHLLEMMTLSSDYKNPYPKTSVLCARLYFTHLSAQQNISL